MVDDLSNSGTKRTVVVAKNSLLTTLKTNKEKHVKEYNEALVGYKEKYLSSINTAFDKAKKDLEKKYNEQVATINSLSEEEILVKSDHVTIVDGYRISIPVPRSFEKEYNVAIDMISWDVRENIELTHAEFVCFVRDEWDWKVKFSEISKMYVGGHK